MKIMKITTSRERRVMIVSTFLMIMLVITTLITTGTGCVLGYCYMKVEQYNKQPVKTDRMTEYIESIQEVRQDVYNSEFVLIRSFARIKYFKVPILLVEWLLCVASIKLEFNNFRIIKKRIKSRKERLLMLS